MTKTVINLVTFSAKELSGQRIFLSVVLLLVQTKTAVSYPFIVIEYVVLGKALQPYMGVIFMRVFLV